MSRIRRRRVGAQLLDRRRPVGLVDAIRHLLAVQAQDPAAFPLALRARVPGLTAPDLVAAREKRTIVRCWGPRGTLHLIATDDLPWLYPLVKPSPAGSLRRLRQLGVDADRAVETTTAVLAGQGPITKPELGERLARAGLAAEGQAIVHLAMLAAGRGLVVLGPERGGKPTCVHAGEWLGSPLPIDVRDREAALRQLVARYRASHDPAEPADLAAWSGLSLTEAKRAWYRSEVDTPEADPVVRLIPAFDEYLLGWRGREHALPAEYQSLIHPGGGVIKSAVLADGRVTGTWTARRAAGRVRVTVRPFEPLPDAELAAEADDMARFLGLPVDHAQPPA